MTTIVHSGPRALFAAIAILMLSSVSALAATESAKHATFDVTIRPQSGTGAPRTGMLALKFNSDGIINGQYRGTSIAPDPLNNRITNVQGGLREHNIWFNIGTTGNMRFSGTLENGTLRMSSVINGRRFNLTGTVVH